MRYDAEIARFGEQFCWNRHYKVYYECRIETGWKPNAAPASSPARARVSRRSRQRSPANIAEKGCRGCIKAAFDQWRSRCASAGSWSGAGLELADTLWVVLLILPAPNGLLMGAINYTILRPSPSLQGETCQRRRALELSRSTIGRMVG